MVFLIKFVSTSHLVESNQIVKIFELLYLFIYLNTFSKKFHNYYILKILFLFKKFIPTFLCSFHVINYEVYIRVMEMISIHIYSYINTKHK